MANDTHRIRKRVWLNSNASQTAFAMLDTSSHASSRGTHFVGVLKIADCNRIVSLDFDAYNNNDRKAALAKAKKLRDLLDKLIDALSY